MTREQAKEIFLNRGYIKVDGGVVYDGDKWREACVVISEWLKEESILDKIRAEIVDLGQRTMNDNRASGIWACRDIIDKYKAESEN